MAGPSRVMAAALDRRWTVHELDRSSHDRNPISFSATYARGTSEDMQIMEPTTTTVPGSDEIDIVVVVETDEHERVEFHGMTRDEIEAKLDDFRTWAS